MKQQNYYLGLDIGTDSVGYAVTDEKYNILKFKGEPAWGSHLFDAANLKADRRTFRTARRRLKRRQQRVQLVQEIFAKEISKVDPEFFIRIQEAALFRNETSSKSDFTLFCDDNYTDRKYHEQYPTIHHLIYDLMTSREYHDPRLVYLAVSWLVAHRGHFLSNVKKENIDEVLDFKYVYEDFKDFVQDNDDLYHIAWNHDNAEKLSDALKERLGVTKKETKVKEAVMDGRKPTPFEAGVIKLLCGGTLKVEKIFDNEDYADAGSLCLGADDEKIAEVLEKIGDDADLIVKLKAIYDWSILVDTLHGEECISKAKISVYDQHKQELCDLKYLVKKYIPKKYSEIFRKDGTANYVAYSYNLKNSEGATKQKCKKEDFYKYIKGIVSSIDSDESDALLIDSIIEKLDAGTYMPKQKDSDNRVIPYQVYWYELNKILENASEYLPSLNDKENGISNKDKLLAIFEFRIPYFVGPLNSHSEFSWMVRKGEGKIYPWNFKDMIDYDESENAFIKQMTNKCTYLPDQNVLPKDSLLYRKYTVLNEINNLKIDGISIPVEAKQTIYNELFMKKERVSLKDIFNCLVAENYITRDQVGSISGVDIKINNSLKTFIRFAPFIRNGKLKNSEVERIIERSAYAEDKSRLRSWLKVNFTQLDDEDIKRISKINIKDFGRLSREFLDGIEAIDKEDSGELVTIIQALWKTNMNLMQIINSDRFTFKEEIEKRNKIYFEEHNPTLDARLDEMYVSNAVKRPIIRTMDIVKDVTKAFGGAPAKIFVEMARGAAENQKNKRTKTRKEQILELYKKVKDEDVKFLQKQLDDMGIYADNKLQSDKLFLYYMQLGKSAYSGKTIDIEKLMSDYYDIDHIYPQRVVKDDSVINNKVLCLSEENGQKTDKFPVFSEWQNKMYATWKVWKDAGLISDEKFKRLTRRTSFTEEELFGFVNRQLVETRQSTKAVATILKEKYPSTEIIYVKAGLVSEFRHAFDRVKSRSFNDLHHAKDAYLNVVVGNVYNTKFTKKWFTENYKKNAYSMKTENIFGHPVYDGDKMIWDGSSDIEKVKKNVVKNTAHLTKYAFCRGGGLFDQMPLKAGDSLVPRKKGLDTNKYGGYNKATASYFMLVKYEIAKKKDMMVMPVELLAGKLIEENTAFAEEYAKQQIGAILGKEVLNISFPLGLRKIKINSVLSLDGYKMAITGKSGGGTKIIMSSLIPLSASYDIESYFKKLEVLCEKTKKNSKYIYDEVFDRVTREENIEMYSFFKDKLRNNPYSKRINNPIKVIEDGEEQFKNLSVPEQAFALLSILDVFGRLAGGCDLTLIGGATKSAVTSSFSTNVSNWRKAYKSVKLIDESPSGLFRKESQNLLDLL